MSAPSITWIEWFDQSKELCFKKHFSNQWEFFLRNGISKVVYTKWIRDNIANEMRNVAVDADRIKELELKWLNEKEISVEEYNKDKANILKEKDMSIKLLKDYCINELRAMQWAEREWGRMVPQLYLEEKEKFDLLKVKILYVKEAQKGLALEIYQMLTEKEEKFERVINHHKEVKYSTHEQGSWMKKIDLKPQIRYTVERLKENGISKPIKINDKYVIAELVDVKGSNLDKDIGNTILRNELNKFISYGINYLTEYSLEQGSDRHNDKIDVDESER